MFKLGADFSCINNIRKNARALLSLLGTGLVPCFSDINNSAEVRHYAYAQVCFDFLCSLFHTLVCYDTLTLPRPWKVKMYTFFLLPLHVSILH
jgi:hypothetical protein